MLDNAVNVSFFGSAQFARTLGCGASVRELACNKGASRGSEATEHMLVTMVTEYSRATCC